MHPMPFAVQEVRHSITRPGLGPTLLWDPQLAKRREIDVAEVRGNSADSALSAKVACLRGSGKSATLPTSYRGKALVDGGISTCRFNYVHTSISIQGTELKLSSFQTKTKMQTP